LSPDADEAEAIHDRIKNLTVSTLNLTGRPGGPEANRASPPPLQPVFSKSVSSFRAPTPPKVTPTYIFGPSYSLRSLSIAGTEVVTRAAPADSLNFLGRAPIGSCPFLFVSTGTDDLIRIGRVLIGASRKDLARIEEIKFPKGTRSFVIREQEPEVTFLETIILKDSAVPAREQLIASDVVLRPGDDREFLVPAGFSEEIILKLRGHYEVLDFARFANSDITAVSSPVRI
jgi:hypothetical protein